MNETFGRYQLLRKLARGGMGEVFLARQRGPVGFEKLLVVKRVLPHLSEDENFIQMFFDEARIAAHLNHPNIAQIYDLGQVDDTYYLAMEYVHGESVSSLNARANEAGQALTMGLKCRIMAEASAGLDFAHRAKSPTGSPLNIIHRDVSPQNILVGFNGCVKLIDFGVAKAVGKVSHTMAGAVKGKHAYMSPEQTRGEPLDNRSDVFGLGIVFYELLTNTRLFKRDSQTETMRAVMTEKPLPLSSSKGIPRPLESIVFKALEKKREDRFQTAGELQLAIEEFVVKHRLLATTAHLAAFMRELFPDSQSERFVDEPTQVSMAHLPSAPSRKTNPEGKARDLSASPTRPEIPRAVKRSGTSSGSGSSPSRSKKNPRSL